MSETSTIDSMKILIDRANAIVRNRPASVQQAESNVAAAGRTREQIKASTAALVAEAERSNTDVRGPVNAAAQANAALKASSVRDSITLTIYNELRTKPVPVVQVAVLLDATGSMQKWIDSVRTHITNAARKLSQLSNFDVRLGLVLYRDIGDGDHQFAVQDFADADTFVAFLEGQRARGGGGDAPEDVLGGFHKLTTALSWDTDSIHACVWCCDAPGHGMGDPSKFNYKDRFPTGDPEGRTIEQTCADLARRQILPVFLRLEDYTDKMIDLFDAVLVARGMPRLPVIALEGTEDLSKQLLNALLTSSTSSIRHDEDDAAGGGGGVAAAAAPRTKRSVPRTHAGDPDGGRSDMRAIEGKMGTYGAMTVNVDRLGHDILRFLHGPMDLKWSENPERVEIANAAFAEGGIRFAYHAKRKKWIVAKDFQRPGFDTLDAHIAEMKGIACASYLADLFCTRLGISRTAFRYVHVAVIDAGSGFDPRTADRRSRFYSFEEQLPGAWVKMNCNTGFVDNRPEYALAQAFSHYTHHATDGEVMVLDVQGNVSADGQFVLSDPAVQTRDRRKFENPTNIGERVIKRFYQSHRCNEHCEKLRLPRMVPVSGV